MAELGEENGQLKRKLALLGAGTRGSVFSVPRRLQVFPRSVAGIEGLYLFFMRTAHTTGA